MPVFTVVAGPNGAGKSTFSTFFSRPGTLIFDPDIEKFKIEKQFPDIAEEALESAVNRVYLNFQTKALGTGLHLTVETNLRNDFLSESAELFKSAGYETRLIYLLLPDIAASMDRVALRVKQKGHFVDAASIKINFEQGPQNMLKISNYFDGVMLLSGINSNLAINTQPQLLLTLKNGKVVFKEQLIPDWCKDMVEFTEVAVANEQKPNRPKR
ncbi:hypothetical protein DYU05_10815 [Mucilaginibacter terrenus]|uniref:Zeta toxin domain-containing protein n=1 Tax=Mucilaginibacter terrenus TaxID=2482727 RepID=A0A3E2NNV6_9SPHI|nr:AAA family ATPase [Mucilaginibacter terrenus]RFZ82668.1 hypothetical protein DYU05_10815 [Mucilaginibacter terrenus]